MDRIFFKSLFEGDCAGGVKLGMGLTGGDFWPRINGCCLLYRGQDSCRVDFGRILKAAELGEEAIEVPCWVEHNSDTIYYYVLRNVNRCGKEEKTFCGAVKVVLDEDKQIDKGRPNRVLDITARQIEGSCVELLWRYSPLCQESAPRTFNVYSDFGSGQLDFDNPAGTIDYSGRGHYRWVSAELEQGRYLFAIKLEDEKGQSGRSDKQIAVELSGAETCSVEILSADVLKN